MFNNNDDNEQTAFITAKADTLASAIAGGQVLTMNVPGKPTQVIDTQRDEYKKIYSIACFRYRFAYWNTRAYAAPYPDYSVAEVRNLVDFTLDVGTIESIWWKEDEDKSFVYSNFNLLANLAAGSIDSVYLYDGTRFKKTKFVYNKS